MGRSNCNDSFSGCYVDTAQTIHKRNIDFETLCFATQSVLVYYKKKGIIFYSESFLFGTVAEDVCVKVNVVKLQYTEKWVKTDDTRILTQIVDRVD